MLKLFGGGKPDHPMATLKEAKRLLAELPADDAFRAVEETSHWLESVLEAEGFKPDYLAQIIGLLDEAGQLPIRKLQRDYVGNPRLSKFQEHKLWTAIHEFWNRLATAYVACIDMFVAGVKGADSLKSEMPSLIVRALRALGAQIKWQHLRYGPFDNSRWGVVARMYAVAELKKLTRNKVSLGNAGETTAELEFLRMAMLAASSPNSLLPGEIELAERLIAHLSPNFKLSLDKQPDIAHWIDLATEHPPLRISRPPQTAPTLRFLAAGAANQELQRLIESVSASRTLPSSLNLGAGQDVSAVLDVLRHLALYWSPKSPERKHPRHRVKSRLNVSPGLAGVIAAHNPAATLDFDHNLIEAWIIDDVSAGGFGASIPQIKGEWLKIDCLVALQPEGGENWVIGVIRRFNRESPLRGTVGIQTLARTAEVISLRTDDSEESEAVLLNPRTDAAELQMIVKLGVFAQGRKYGFLRDGKEIMLMSVTLQGSGDDYELLRARPMIRDVSE